MPKPKLILFNNIMSPYTSRLWNNLSDIYEVLVVSCCDEEPNRQWSADFVNRFDHKLLPGFSIKLSPARFAHVNVGFRKVIKSFKPDLVICNGFYPTMLGVALACRMMGVPYIIQNDGWKETMPVSAYHNLIRPFILKHCRGVIACSGKGGEYFSSQGVPRDMIFVSHLAPAWDEPEILPSYSERKYDLLWTAQVNKTIKNCLFFADIVASLASRRPGLKVCVVGDGPDRAELVERLSQTSAEVDYFPKVRWDKIHEIFLTSRLMLLPSLWEPWGLVCNEAMQSGTPCMVSRHVGAAGELVDNENGAIEDLVTESWVGTCERLLEPSTWEAHSTNAVETARRFGFKTYQAGYIEAFNTILARLGVENVSVEPVLP